MTVRAKNRTPAGRAQRLPQPVPVYSQTEQRERRRAGLLVTLTRRWSLSSEVAAICDPLAQRTAAMARPAALGREVDALTLAVHGLMHAVVGLLAEADAQRRTRHLGVDQRGRSIRALVDLAERPSLPEITDDMIGGGTWPATLILLADPYTADLSALLGNALTSAVSDRVLAPLREVDAAATSFARRLDRQRPRVEQPKMTKADQARAELAALGVATD
ncbi:hypothetical protein [Mycobacterium sp. SMC-14]|uniref:hypothetical protein n=1 Tax=Mycobacterium sp. SMC-14 TaxID=3385968 RepID=UPI00390C9FB8